MKTAYFRIHEEDNVAIALEQLEPGCEIQFTGGCCTAAEVIPRGHKVALSDLEPGQEGILTEGAQKLAENQKQFEVGPRTIVVFCGRTVDGKETGKPDR